MRRYQQQTREELIATSSPPLLQVSPPCPNRPASDNIGWVEKRFIGRNDTTLRYLKPSSVDGGEAPNLGSHLAEARRISAVMKCNAGGKWWNIGVVFFKVFYVPMSGDARGQVVSVEPVSPLDASGKGIASPGWTKLEPLKHLSRSSTSASHPSRAASQCSFLTAPSVLRRSLLLGYQMPGYG